MKLRVEDAAETHVLLLAVLLLLLRGLLLLLLLGGRLLLLLLLRGGLLRLLREPCRQLQCGDNEGSQPQAHRSDGKMHVKSKGDKGTGERGTPEVSWVSPSFVRQHSSVAKAMRL